MAISKLGRWLAASLMALGLGAQDGKAPAAPGDAFGRDTPRGSVLGFLRATGSGDYQRAARHLQSDLPAQDAQQLAKELAQVLDRRFQIDIERLSSRPEGNLNDDTRAERDPLGVIRGASGPVEVALERVPGDAGSRIWLFSADTLKEIPRLYRETDGFWIEAYVPDGLRDARVAGLPPWRWLMWLLGAAIAWAGSALLQSLFRVVLRPVLRRLDPGQPQPAALALGWPLRVVLFAVMVMLLSSYAATILSRQFWFQVGATVAVISGGWLLSRIADTAAIIGAHRLRQQTGMTEVSSIWLMQRAAKVLIGIAVALFLLKLAHVELTGVITGLGLGGLAFAFAAQKTIENLFGGVMITTDGSLRVGDFCRIGEHLGTVVDIGIRSTRMRTLGRTIVSIPNGQTAAASIENFAERDKFLWMHVVGVRYETGAAGMREVLEALRQLLLSYSDTEKESVRARFIRFGASSLDIEMRVYVFAADFDAFLARQEEMLLAVMDTLAERGVGIAFPSQTVYVAQDK